MTIALLCGGPSPERGISLNSARSVLDHLGTDNLIIRPIYFDVAKRPYLLSPTQLYSNTPSDFDFKLARDTRPLTEEVLLRELRSADLIFPVMHGAFGEDGQIQSFLERHNLPFIGSPAQACKKAFDKFNANELIRSLGFYAPPSIVLKIYAPDHAETLQKFFTDYQLTRAIVKPATGGSSIGVFSVSTADEALDRVQHLFSKRVDTRVVVEPFCAGTEFTIIILQNRFGLPVALVPTEIETNYTEHQIFDYRKKYLPTRQVTYHCPPRFSHQTIETIQTQAEQLFAALGMRDFARFDGWVTPDGQIWFSDFNPVSGMEQNSFLFQQASRVGFSHSDVLRYIVGNAAHRYKFNIPHQPVEAETDRPIVPVLMGGSTSERQVSLMSGTNVWLKLRHSPKYQPEPYLLDPDGSVWKLPYALLLNHTVEEVAAHAASAAFDEAQLSQFEHRCRQKLALLPDQASFRMFRPEHMSLERFVASVPYVFIALHGGFGENGQLQAKLEQASVHFNGSDAQASALCINKYNTSQRIRQLHLLGISTPNQRLVSTKDLVSLKGSGLRQFWNDLRRDLATKSIIVKPIDDGCSSGIVRLNSADDLQRYLTFATSNVSHIPANSFAGQNTLIEMPQTPPQQLLLEQYIETDTIRVVGNHLKISHKTGWVEMTVGVLGHKGCMTALSPSLTIAEGQVLSLEEKFQGGTGVNITPPGPEIIPADKLNLAKQSVATVANHLGLSDYARIDIFVHRPTGKIMVIEVNTLPGLTPSTVLFHQALAEPNPIYPTQLLEQIIELSGYIKSSNPDKSKMP